MLHAMAGAPPFASAAPVGGAGEQVTAIARAGAGAVATAPGLRVQTFAYLAAGAGKKQWMGCWTKDRPGDRGKKYGFHTPVSEMMTSMLEDNSVALTPQLRAFVENRSGDVRISDCVDYPGQQGKYVVMDILQAVRGTKDINNNREFMNKYIIDAKDPSGELLYPSLAEVPNGNPRGGTLAVINIRDVYTLLGRWVDVMKDIGSRAAFEQNAAPEIAMGRAAQNILSPSASQREQQEAAAAQGLGGGVGALGGSAENAIVAILKESMTRASEHHQQAMVAMGGMSSRVGTVEDKVDAVDGRVDAMDGKVEDVRREATEKANAMDGKVEDVRREATEKVGAFEVRLNAVAASAYVSGQHSMDVLAEHTQKLAELASLKRKVDEIEAAKRAPGAPRRTFNMVWGRKIHGMHIHGKFKKPPKSGILLIHKHQDRYVVRDFFKEQNAKRLKFQTGAKPILDHKFTYSFSTAMEARHFRDETLAKLHLYVEDNEEGEYRVAVMPGYDEAAGGGAASAGDS